MISMNEATVGYCFLHAHEGEPQVTYVRAHCCTCLIALHYLYALMLQHGLTF